MKNAIPTTKVTAANGDLVEVQWDARKTRFAIFLRYTRTGSAVVRMERVEPGTLGVYHRTGTYSDAPRTIASYDILRIVQTCKEREASERKATDANTQRVLDLGGTSAPSELAIAWEPWTCHAQPAPHGKPCLHINTKPTYYRRDLEVCEECGCTKKASDDRTKEKGK